MPSLHHGDGLSETTSGSWAATAYTSRAPRPPGKVLRPVPDTANRSLTLAETEMLRNLNKEFRGNGPPDALYSGPFATARSCI
ncbi:hypothetical protein GCM10027074_08270 [Streptomyces deserti]